ncbi:MAG: Cell division topological specificity factor [Legionellaceae bacterium]
MSIFNIIDYFRSQPKNTASLAKERLQIIVSHERTKRGSPDFLDRLQKELLEVISKYVHIDKDQVKIDLARSGDFSILELNVTLPDNLQEKDEI